MRSSSSLAGATLFLVIIATTMLQISLYDRQGFVPHEWVQLAIVCGVAVFIRRMDPTRTPQYKRTVFAVAYVLFACLAFSFEAITSLLTYYGNPFEVQVALTLRNLMIGLAADSRNARSQKFASLASCFLALCSILWLMNTWNIVLLFAYVVTGMWWLMGAYWDRLSDCFLSQSERAIPWKATTVATLLAVLVVLVALPLATSQQYTTAIQGFLPSSGGTRWKDENAFGGVGDGPQMVSAKENASSFGPIESELFLESQMPSLYDVFNEFSDPPAKKKKKKGRQRAIPLAPSLMQENHQKRSVNKKPSREFSAVRNRKRKTPSVSEQKSNALLQVVGRVPIHLGLYTYDQWDGQTLSSSDSGQQLSLSLKGVQGSVKKVAQVDGVSTNSLLIHQEHHELRIVNLKTDRIPSPPNISSIHIDKLHTARLFKPTLDGMVAIDLDFIPQLTVLHLESLQRRVHNEPKLSKFSEDLPNDDPFAQLARRWTEGIPVGWPQVEAICDRLQTEYVLDPQALVTEEVEDAALHFLFDSKQGPDYLFATSTAMLLRSLGYETRVVSGFYAREENYERQARLTPVYAADAHFWVEVLTSTTETDGVNQTRTWLPVEPSPGYQVLYAPETLWSHLFHRAVVTWEVVRNNPIASLVFVAIAAVVWRKRVDICDLLLTLWWRMHHQWGDVRQQVQSTVRLLDRRANVRGFPRSKGTTLKNWRLSPHSPHGIREKWEAAFLSLANWAFYGEGHPTRYTTDEIQALCTEAAAHALRPSRQQSNDGLSTQGKESS